MFCSDLNITLATDESEKILNSVADEKKNPTSLL
jgi:hypothetical protein